MMYIKYLLELFLFSVVYEGPIMATNKEQMNFNYCKLSTKKNNKKTNVGNVLFDDLFLQTTWMSHKGCFYDNGSWDATAIYTIEWNITASCSCKCRKNDFFALRGNRCACLYSLLNMMETNIHNCIFICPGSEKDPCGGAKYFTVYEHKVSKITTDTNMQISMSSTRHKIISKTSTTTLVTERKITTDTNVQTSLSTILQKVISKISTTAFEPVTKPSFPVKMTKITVISVVLASIITGLVVIVILIIRKWNRIKHYFHNTTCDGTNRTAEGEESLQMTSSNQRSNFRSFDVPLVCQQTHHFGIYPVTNYENFTDMDNSCQRLDYTLPNEVQQMSTTVHDADYPDSTNNGAKRSTKEGTAVSTTDEEQEHLAYYSTIAEEEVIYDLPQDAY